MKRSILLTGVAGFIGSRTAELFLEEDYRVVGIDNLNDYYDIRLKEYRLNCLKKYRNFEFHQIDIEDLSALKPIFEGQRFDGVVNLAARAGVRYSLINPFVYIRTNVLGTTNLLELCKDYSINKFILASTSSLYAGQSMPFREDLPVNKPVSVYAASKKGAEAVTYTYHYLYGITTTILRYFTVYGPAGRPDMSIFRFIEWIKEGSPLELYGDGTQSRDFTYVDDIAEGTVAAFKIIESGYQIINLGGNNPYDLNYAIGLIEDFLGKKGSRKTMPFHNADLKATWADITKAKRLFHWSPKVSLAEGIEKTIRWHLDNRDWIEEIRFIINES